MTTTQFTDQQLAHWIDCADEKALATLYRQANAIKHQHVGSTVYFRGLIEMSNICQKNCLYCGIRLGNPQTKRYIMSDDEVVEAAIWAHQQEYGSIVIQAGEQQSTSFTNRISNLLRRIHQATDRQLGITLSLGEQSESVYAEWFDAGAKRYLLRIETSNPDLYATLHPSDHLFEERLQCLCNLQKLGYQTGTGIMIGFPHQTTDDLVADLRFFQNFDIDMIGMGPYIPHDEAPLAKDMPVIDKQRQLQRAITVLALARILMPDINLAAATALQALDPRGREKAIAAGANVIMPNVTDTRYREGYQLYNGKPCMDENAGQCRGCLKNRIASVGETIGFGQHGDAPHFFKRKGLPLPKELST